MSNRRDKDKVKVKVKRDAGEQCSKTSSLFRNSTPRMYPVRKRQTYGLCLLRLRSRGLSLPLPLPLSRTARTSLLGQCRCSVLMVSSV